MISFKKWWKTLNKTLSGLFLEKPPVLASEENLQEVTLHHLKVTENEPLEHAYIIQNLRKLKTLLDQPKESALEERFKEITEHLGMPESYETIRQERWHDHIYCPACQSPHLKRLPPLPSMSTHNHRYECLACHFIFNDDTGTPLEEEHPPLNTWMHCWYLMGCTDSLAYIAHKLGVDITVVEMMVLQLKKTFGVDRPLTREVGYEEWSEQSGRLRQQLKEELLKYYEQLNANVATAPKDTMEFRRQQNLRRTLNASTHPPAPALRPPKGKKPK